MQKKPKGLTGVMVERTSAATLSWPSTLARPSWNVSQWVFAQVGRLIGIAVEAVDVGVIDAWSQRRTTYTWVGYDDVRCGVRCDVVTWGGCSRPSMA